MIPNSTHQLAFQICERGTNFSTTHGNATTCITQIAGGQGPIPGWLKLLFVANQSWCLVSDAGKVSVGLGLLLPGFCRPRRWGEREMPVDDRIALLTFAVLVDHAVYVRHSFIGAAHVPGRG